MSLNLSMNVHRALVKMLRKKSSLRKRGVRRGGQVGYGGEDECESVSDEGKSTSQSEQGEGIEEEFESEQGISEGVGSEEEGIPPGGLVMGLMGMGGMNDGDWEGKCSHMDSPPSHLSDEGKSPSESEQGEGTDSDSMDSFGLNGLTPVSPTYSGLTPVSPEERSPPGGQDGYGMVEGLVGMGGMNDGDWEGEGDPTVVPYQYHEDRHGPEGRPRMRSRTPPPPQSLPSHCCNCGGGGWVICFYSRTTSACGQAVYC